MEVATATRSRRPGQEPPGSRGHSHRNYKGTSPKAPLCFAEKGEDPGSRESQRKDGIVETRQGSWGTGGKGPASLLHRRVWHDACEDLGDTRDWAGVGRAAGPPLTLTIKVSHFTSKNGFLGGTSWAWQFGTG